MKIKIGSLLIFMITSKIAFTQESKISIKKAFETNTIDDTKPAILSFTSPSGNSSSYLINAGIGYGNYQIKKIKTNFGGFVVYNYNNQIGKEQKNYKIGIKGKTDFNTNNLNYVFATHTLQYLRNYIDTNHSAILTTYWTYFSKNKNKMKFGGYSNPTKGWSYFLYPLIGLEYQNLIDTKIKTINMSGFDLRSIISLGGNFLIRSKSDSIYQRTKLIEFTINYDIRHSFSSSISNNKKEKYLFKAGLNFYIPKSDNFSLGLAYNKGENPVDGTKNQEFWLLAFQYKLN